MQGGRRGQNGSFDFGDPFAGFGGIDHGMLSGLFGGRDPFEDPFFTRPFGAPFGSLFQPSLFGSVGNGGPGHLFPPALFPPPLFGSVESGPFHNEPATRSLEHQLLPNKRKGPVIEEINSDDEEADGEGSELKKDNSRKHSRSAKEPYVEEPDDVNQEKKNEHMECGRAFNRTTSIQPLRRQQPQPQPETQSFTFHSSTVTYGGAKGAYYTKSMTKRAGSDGVSFQDFKEADSSTGQATHRISRGLNQKGHTLTRKLNSDGRVDSMQTLHNLDQDELPSFEENWRGNARQHLPGWGHQLQGYGSGDGNGNRQSAGGDWALPSTQPAPHPASALPSTQHVPHPRIVNPNMGMKTSSSSHPHGVRNPRSGPQGRKRA